ncbi:aldehyde dehydrogenase [Bosea vaviloviae]|uniref:Aldehyde dehydrogenase n=1 Tax=Bosea vaviloviae TaxID=1526658 RepID=A0A1D7TZN5_9HYPH|nr:aldehyde dehydrogenase [Bosea vaviloviae]AOO80584.1 aldehyde dehydrogenase [Bosea vaviloviae]
MIHESPAFYLAIADRLTLPTKAFIDGSFVAAKSGAVIETVNPATGLVLAAVAHCQAEDVDRTVAAARRAFRSGVWSRVAPEARKAVLLRLAELIRANSTELAVLESLDSGKPIRDCLKEIAIEVPDTFQWYAELIDKSFGKVAPTGEQACALILREPIGVVAAVLPWNFPLLMAAWKLAPALACGCSVLVKPAEQTSMSILRLAELANEAGIPAGVLNVLPGLGETAGQAIGRHGDIDAVSFTGSTEVGRLFLRYAADSNLKSIGLEMGGKSPFIVLDDAELSPEMIDNAVMAAFWNGGQNCSANMRQIVDRSRQEEFLDRVVERAKALVIGAPLDPATELGPLITREHRRRVLDYVESGSREGARAVLSGAAFDSDAPGSFLGPTVFADLAPEMTIAREEIFGPVLGVMPVDGIEQALTIANGSEYGLHATVYTRDIDRALFMARRLACGTVAVNGFTEGDLKTPFGGYKRSGSLARDKGTEAMAQYLQTKTIWLSLDGRYASIPG